MQDISFFAYYFLMSSQGEAAKVKACVTIFISYIWNGNFTHVFVQFVEDHHPLVDHHQTSVFKPMDKKKGLCHMKKKNNNSQDIIK